MATAPAVLIRWIPEDDLLLKNAVEGGASLEALAKGAVQFSRRFTLRELRDRWHSLLYDPEISGQSSARMFELEISGFNSSSKFIRSENNLKGSKEILQKRKLESVRRKYYAMRKKFRSEIFSNSDLGFFEPDPHEFSRHVTDFQKPVTLEGNSMGQNCILGDSISDHLRLQEEDLDILRQAFPETIGDIAVASGTAIVSQTGCPNSFEDNCTNGIIGSYGFDGNVTSTLSGGNDILDANVENRSSSLTLNNTSRNENPRNAPVGFEDRQFKSPNSDGFSSFQTIMFASEQPHLRHLRVQDVSAPSVPVSMPLRDAGQVAEDMLPDDVDGQESRCAVHTGEFGDPDSLLNLSNDDEILLMDVDETNAEDRSCYDNIVSVIQDSQIDDDQENDVAIVDIANVAVTETSCAPAPTSNPVVLEVVASSTHEEEQINLHQEVNIPLKSTSNSDFTEVTDGKIFCTLNTEDTEIPCNDDIFLLIHPSTSFGSSATQPDIKGSMDLSTAAHEKNNEQVLNLPTKARDNTKAFGGPQKGGMYRLSESHSTHPHVGFSANTEMPDSRANTLLPGFANKAIGDSSKGRLLYTIPKACSDSLVEKDITGGAMKVGDSLATVTEMIQSTEATSGRIVVPESVIDSSVSDEEESQIDADVPYFSDVEAMILEMDLDPYDQDSHLTRQASSYMCDDTKRTIIRLEQGACSCLQRVMTSQGALAILYGRHLRHYIKKPEVVLGRSTDDVDVDIDLRKEGRANKISRRQAIIKMEADGSFLLKNLGKSLVSVNGITVATGQLLTLSSSCLIEIRGMSFVFEINQKYVKQNLGNVIQRNKEKSIKPERFT